MTSILLALCALSVAVGLAGLYAWFLDRRAERVDSAYRAACLVAVSRADFPPRSRVIAAMTECDLAEPESYLSDPYCREGWEAIQ